MGPSSNKNEPPHRAHLKSLEPKMRTTTLLILPLLVASIHGESICPEGYYSIAENLDGAGKTWVQPHPDPTRTLLDCADICDDTTGCTSFEYANGPDEHGACGWYNGGDSNIKANENRTQANSNWYSCIRASISAMSGSGYASGSGSYSGSGSGHYDSGSGYYGTGSG